MSLAFFIIDWLHEYQPLTDALVLLRELQDVTAACDVLLDVPAVDLPHGVWGQWQEEAGLDDDEADLLLAEFLNADQIDRLRFALWGTGPNPSSDATANRAPR